MPVKTDEKKPKNGADIVVQTLEPRGVEYVFGVPGAKIDKVFDTLVDSKITTVVCRHEQNAAFIAGGIGRMTGKAGIALATSGPGVSNLVTGLATANTEGDPVIALGGAVAVADRLKKVHQTMDSVSLCRPVTKYSAEVDSPESVSEILTNAFRTAESGPPGSGLCKSAHGHHAGTCQVRRPHNAGILWRRSGRLCCYQGSRTAHQSGEETGGAAWAAGKQTTERGCRS
jgi:glyoxylate carboligase